ncbi:MAG: DUF6512 family protein [Patescibacteria group bacterium]|nr:DUF6512 family protein [Patescibacteria group bacterium]MCL5261860.1 DUF6512 family protein [Patescibacteria group bacterium]
MLFNIVFTIVVGSLLHFTFDFFHQSLIVGLFSAVDESVWEHLKLAVMPMAFISFWQGWRRKQKPNNFWLSRAKAVYFAAFAIVVLFYGYTAVLGKNYLFLDIAIFIVSVVAAEIMASVVQKMRPFPKSCETASKIMILFAIFIFMYFTVYPPKSFLFKDPAVGGYGLETNQVCVAGDCDTSIILPPHYSIKAYSIEKVLDQSCVRNIDCKTPAEYLIQSPCPFVSLCLEGECTVICPDFLEP